MQKTIFDIEELSRGTFNRLLELMRSDKFVSRGLCEFPARYGVVRPGSTFIAQNFSESDDFHWSPDVVEAQCQQAPRGVFLYADRANYLGSAVAKIYLWHCRINWDLRWMVMKFKTRFSKHAQYSFDQKLICL